MTLNYRDINYSNMQLIGLAALRVLIGWHFLYEGLVKVINPNWSSAGYLMDSQGFLAGFFQSLATNQSVLSVVDFMNMWGLVAIGLGLILGCFSRIALSGGISIVAVLLPFPSAFCWTKIWSSDGRQLPDCK